MTIEQFIRVFGACCVLSVVVDICQANQADDEAAIRTSDAAYVEAYNKQDAKALAALWSPEAVYVDPETGAEVVGREAIEKEFAETFSNQKNAKLEIKVAAIKFMSPNVAVESGTARIIVPDADPDESNYSALFVKQGGKWLLDRVSEEETPIEPSAPPSNYDHLKDLEWMIGSWIDQDDTDHTMVHTDCSWTKNKNFITRPFAVVIGDSVDLTGIQFIGWDPVSKQIHSWVFDSDGGFGEGKWTKKGDRWTIQQIGTLPDGRKASEVNIIRPIDDNSFTWQTVQRSVNGDLLPDSEEVTIVRKPAQ